MCDTGKLCRLKRFPKRAKGIWLELDDFDNSPIWEELMQYISLKAGTVERAKKAKSIMFFFTPVETEFAWRSSETHTVRRTGFALTHAQFLSSTASQGQTVRTGATIDCARIQPQGMQGLKDADWWLHLYVLFSRATCMEDMLLLRPPPRQVLEAGPPAEVQAALQQFEAKIRDSTQAAAALAETLGFQLPT